MKKVQLFAVAAAMGMFASTVSAAEYVTKDAYVATWGNVDEIIKVDVGDKVVLPMAEISVIRETRTTDPKYASGSDSLGIEDSAECYAGFTNIKGVDNNEDGYVDAKLLTAGIDNLTQQGWLHTDAKFFPSAKTALYYVGLTNGNDVTSGRFLAPGAEKKDVYALGLSHKHLANEEEVLKHFEDAGILNFTYDSKEYIDYVDVNPIVLKNAKGNNLGTVSIRIESKETRYADDAIREDIVKMLVTGVALTSGDDYTVKTVISENYTDKTQLPYSAVINKVTTEVPANSILLVEEDRYGNLIPTGVATTGDIHGVNGTPISYPTDGKIIVALDTEEKDAEGNKLYSKYMTITRTSANAFTPKSTMVWDDENGTFMKQTDEAREYALGTDTVKGFYWNNKFVSDKNEAPKAVTADDIAIPAHALGLYHLQTPANPSDKIVIDTDGLNLTISGINTKKETMTIGYGNNKELTTSAVKLGNKWYPAVKNEAELTKFVEKVLGLTTLEGEYDEDVTGANNFDKWVEGYETAVANPLSGIEIAERTNAKGEKEQYIPQNSMQHYSGTFCTYKMGEGEKVEATITGNVNEVDTSTHGVKTLTLTAKVGDEVVATKDVKVVVAPKYERTYVNGRVVTLKAFHLNGNLYAVYNYDWNAKTYTATFYRTDGVTVDSTANGSL